MRKEIALDRLPLALQARDTHRQAMNEILAKVGGEVYGFDHKFIPASRKRELLHAYTTIHRLWKHENDRIESLCEVIQREIAFPSPEELEADVLGKRAINLDKLAKDLGEIRADYFTGANNDGEWNVRTRDLIDDLITRINQENHK